MDTVRVGLIGSGFVSAIHHEALRRVHRQAYRYALFPMHPIW